jgi:hypothetical protein
VVVKATLECIKPPIPFNPTTLKFAKTTGNMVAKRDCQTSTLLNTGKVLLVGGINNFAGTIVLASA